MRKLRPTLGTNVKKPSPPRDCKAEQGTAAATAAHRSLHAIRLGISPESQRAALREKAPHRPPEITTNGAGTAAKLFRRPAKSASPSDLFQAPGQPSTPCARGSGGKNENTTSSVFCSARGSSWHQFVVASSKYLFGCALVLERSWIQAVPVFQTFM